MKLIDLTVTLVLYKNDKSDILKAIESVFSIDEIEFRMFVFDNSPTSDLKNLFDNYFGIHYIHLGENKGFGKGHNEFLNLKNINSIYHLILNPDVNFDGAVVTSLIEYFKKDKSAGLLGPKILYSDGRIQNSTRKFPGFIDFITRRMSLMRYLLKKRFIDSHYLNNQDSTKPFEVEVILGCFMLFRTDLFRKLNGFDERFFMYVEDVDICRRVWENSMKVIFVPNVVIYHKYAKESRKRINMAIIHFKSILIYFRKWGFKL